MTYETQSLTDDVDCTAAIDDSRCGALEYGNIEKMRRACEAEGWCLDFFQLEPGDLAARLSIRRFGGVSVMRRKVNLRVEVVGKSPADHLTLIAPVSGNSIWVNGRSIDQRHALLLRPDARLHLLAGPAAVTQARIPCALLDQHGFSKTWPSTTSNRSGGIFVDMRAGRARSLRLLMRDAFFRGHTHVGHRLAERTIDIIDDAFRRPEESDQAARGEAWRTISRACEFIWKNQHKPILLADVCDHAVASVSKLVRTFRREFELSPGRYILVRRLSAVNRALSRAAASDNQVSALALDHGFRHHGRFAADYRRHFGELPSETLRN